MIKPLKQTLCLLFGIILMACSNADDDQISTHVTKAVNPLPECPSSPNCYRVTLGYTVAADSLLKASEKVLIEMGASEVDVNENNQSIAAVFTIWLFRFKDDVKLNIEQTSNQTLLHIRSASRKGYSDLGVNRHRVNQIIRRLESNMDV